MKDITMKKILSLVLVCSFFVSEPSLIDKVKTLPGKTIKKIKTCGAGAKDFAINTINTAKENKKATFITALQACVAANQIYRIKQFCEVADYSFHNIFVTDDYSFLSTAKSAPFGKLIAKLQENGIISEDTTKKIINKGFTPLTYAQAFFDNGTGFTLALLEIIKRSLLKTE